MPVELRKRKAPEPAPAPPPKKAAAPKKTTAKGAAAKVVAKAKEVVKKGKGGKAAVAKSAPSSSAAAVAAVAADDEAPAAPAPAAVNGSAKKGVAAPAVVKPAAKGDTIDFEGFGGSVETHEGVKTTLKALVDESKAGVVIFTYPKASTPGCTNQACLFRDSYTPLTAGGLSIYGLSADSPKENTKFKEKQKLPYPLLCDPKATLLAAIGLKKGPSKAARGVFVVDKAGKVLVAQLGSPAGTLEVVKKIVEEDAGSAEAAAVEEKVDGEEKKAGGKGKDEEVAGEKEEKKDE